MSDIPHAKPVIAIIQFPGSNCETESIHAVTQAGMLAEEFLWNRNAGELAKYDGYFIIGGFSYEDRSRSGVISAKNVLMAELIAQAKLGKPIIGVCNGAQILIESGLVPGLSGEQIGGALAVNVRKKDGHVVGTGFYNTWCHHKVVSKANIFMTEFEDGEVFDMPIAHGEGRFVFPPEVLNAMENNGQILFKYCNENCTIEDNFPTNPNGTMDNIAAIGNPSGNVIAMMPHPERSIISPKFFTAMRKYIEENNFFDCHLERSQRFSEVGDKGNFKYKTININLPKPEIQDYANQGQQLIIQSVITDKEASTINQTLKELGIIATVFKTTHWEMGKLVDLQAIIKSEELHNPNKENIINLENSPHLGRGKTVSFDEGSIGVKVVARFLISYNTDVDGESKKEILQGEGISVTSLKKSILWAIEGDYQAVLNSNILANPFSQTIVRY
jgi:phosphoribosylformylglycinamidine synthase subunit PurQ / glutaminase